MFTGIVQDVGRVQRIEPYGEDLRLTIGSERLDFSGSRVGDSVAVAGVCLTAVALQARALSVDVSRETLARTSIAGWREGRRVNLEPALRAGDVLGGHLVAGHVDGVARVLACSEDARSRCLRVQAPAPLMRYLARKGSVTLDGVSLTINRVEAEHFEVNLVPHTLAVTTLGELAVNDPLNLEVDLIARYVERLLQPPDDQL
ncbi:MAG TPA: riboflavin synthase [Steroidobacteraceae bacterium]|nr:riboflavin synthase [Steroidobacteraceae bacterium]